MSVLLSAEDKVENYRGSSYNLFLAFEPSCLKLVGSTDVINEHFSALAKFGICDTYTDDTQSYLRQSVGTGMGMAFYTNSVYRDSFFLASTVDVEKVWLHDIVQDIVANSFALKGNIGIGYQMHFQRGYILSAGIYYTYVQPVRYTNTSDDALNEELSSSKYAFIPTFLIGWRF